MGRLRMSLQPLILFPGHQITQRFMMVVLELEFGYGRYPYVFVGCGWSF